MVELITAAALGIVYFVMYRHDRRMLRNGVVIVAAVWFAFLGLSTLAAQFIPGTEYLILAVVILLPLAVVALAAFLIANGFSMVRKEGRRLGNLLSFIAGLAILALPFIALGLVTTGNAFAIGLAMLMFFLCSYFGVVFVIFLSYAIIYGKGKQTTSPSSVVVLGSQIINGKVPPLLRSRLEKGLEVYRSSKPAPLLIPSGGQGADESIAEGDAMAAYLVDAGVIAKDVVSEDRAVNTEQNLAFSAVLAAERGHAGKMVIVTNDYHALRAALLSRKLGLDAEAVGSKTAKYFVPSAFLREFVAVVMEHRKLHLMLFLPFLALTSIVVWALLTL